MKAFEMCYEQAWLVLQDVLKALGFTTNLGPNPVIDQSLKLGIIEDNKDWAQINKDRKKSVHTYN